MGTLLVVDGSDICRAPIVEFTLRARLAGAGWLDGAWIRSRGLSAVAGSTMCENAASRLGFTGPAIGFFGAHRATPLSVADIAGADLVLTAERAQRSAVVRMLPGTQAMVFTWKEALALATVTAERRRIGSLGEQPDLAALARVLHGARGTVPLVEPTVRTGPFHWRRSNEVDPLTVADGHSGAAEHRRVTQESADVASALGTRLIDLTAARIIDVSVFQPEMRRRRPRRPV